ncbi:MAG: hypothetical protein LBE35_08715 [Clostridiales bacterium]|jgi:hypothetical protein|nr:hypothetical protein [Clostridiales bacterium]
MTNNAIRQREIEEMAFILTEKESPSPADMAVYTPIAQQLFDGIDHTFKVLRGEIVEKERPSTREWLEEMIKEIEEGTFEYDED